MKKKFATIALVAAVAAVLPALASAQSTIDYSKYGDYAKFGSATDAPGACSYQSIGKKNYKGRTLKVITHAVPVMGEPTDLHAKQFSDLTGAKVDVVHVPFGDLFQRIMIPLQTK